MSSTCSIEESRQPKGAVLFTGLYLYFIKFSFTLESTLSTGPDSVGNLRVSVKERRFVGHGALSPEASGDTQYIMRGASVRSPRPELDNALRRPGGWDRKPTNP